MGRGVERRLAVSVRITDTDHGYRARLDAIYGIRNPQIEIGILEAEGAEAKKLPGGGTASGVTVLDVATWMEFGYHHAAGNFEVLPRSFVRAWFDHNERAIRELVARVMKSVIAGKIDKEQALERIGLWAAGGMQKWIADGKVTPPLAQSTIDAKGSSVPLEDSGQLRTSVTFRVKG